MIRAVASGVLVLACCGAQAQATAPSPVASGSRAQPAATCPNAQDVEPRQLVGLWHAKFEGLPRGATLLLEPHHEYAGSLSGEINRDGERGKVAADLDDDGFTLEESSDGVHIAATWLGDVVEGSCGNEIRGSWGPATGTARPFVLRRAER